MTEHAQDEIIAFLENEALGPDVQRVDTHGAAVFLAGGRALKMKRAIRFSFLDFSSLAKRERALRDELRLNRRTAPDLYERVLPVTREAEGGLALDGAGEPVEWLLAMRRFPSEAQLDRHAAAHGLSRELLEELAHGIACFHEAAEPRPDRGGHAAMQEVVEGNAGDLESLAGSVLDSGQVAALNAATRAVLAADAELLDARRAAGRVRHCHGDLHLANIVLLDGRPTLFDCIEFNEEFACVDLLYDLGFLLMDLIHRGLPREAQIVLQAWLEEVPDEEGLALLPLFLSVRATVRAKISGFTVRLAEDEETCRRAVAEANAYLQLALDFLEPAPPRLVAVAGRSGTGKTSLARALAPGIGAAPGAVILRSDVIRKRQFGRAPTERLPPEAYRPEVSQRVFAEIAARAGLLLRAGRAVIADGVYGLAEQRREIEAVAEEAGVPFLGLWLEAPEEVLEARVAARNGDASDATVEVVRMQRNALETPAAGWQEVPAGRPVDAIAAELRPLLED
ncbi:bifunctional aminoglycoside phosphotransferase/ATP-binding protein [Marinimicrococcus flavescens]|uniref:AAA family ATPase n=1 Tax=Marinimicrococcus flavescens TaxID=3031815 RepID=A0AAP3UZ80_9PROT|nr:AAA family ATPase [Marinimicrococcus flavescens]